MSRRAASGVVVSVEMGVDLLDDERQELGSGGSYDMGTGDGVNACARWGEKPRTETFRRK